MTRLCAIDDVPENGARECRDAAGDLLVLRTPEGVRAYRNVCPHQGRALNFAPGEFLFTPAGELVCPHHGARFDPATGVCVEGPCRNAALTPLPVRVEQGAVWLETPASG